MKKRHPSMRGYFAYELYHEMRKNDDVWLLMGDLGYKVFDAHRADFPDRCINTGAAEQTMLDMAVGLAQEGKKPVCYSITPFLLFRAAETIRTYINHEKPAVKLIGSGRDSDYAHDGFSHYAGDDQDFMKLFPSIKEYRFKDKKEIDSHAIETIIRSDVPVYVNLKR